MLALLPRKVIWLFLIGCTMLLPMFALAQSVHQDLKETVRAVVVSVDREFERRITGTDATALVQELTIEIVEGDKGPQATNVMKDDTEE